MEKEEVRSYRRGTSRDLIAKQEVITGMCMENKKIAILGLIHVCADEAMDASTTAVIPTSRSGKGRSSVWRS
jgi:hypothetical protein